MTRGKSVFGMMVLAERVATGQSSVAIASTIEIADGVHELFIYVPTEAERRELVTWRLRMKYRGR